MQGTAETVAIMSFCPIPIFGVWPREELPLVVAYREDTRVRAISSPPGRQRFYKALPGTTSGKSHHPASGCGAGSGLMRVLELVHELRVRGQPIIREPRRIRRCVRDVP